MKGTTVALLGIGVILLGIAFSTNNFWGCLGGVLELAYCPRPKRKSIARRV